MSATRFKSARLALGLNQMEAAEKLEIGQSFLSKVERGDKRPNTDLLTRMAKLYGVTETYLLGHEPPAPVLEAGSAIDENTPPGLRALAADHAISESLGITDEEWRVLRSIDMPAIGKGGYVQLLSTIRGIREQSARFETRGRPSGSKNRGDDDEAT